MRPTASIEPFQRPRKRSVDQVVTGTKPSNPTTFFLAKGADRETRSEHTSTENVVTSAIQERSSNNEKTPMTSDSAENKTEPSTNRSFSRSHSINSQTDHHSHPLTPLLFGSPGEGSLPSSPKSVSTRSMPIDSTQYETSSQAIVSDEEDQDNRNSVPQLIMPSIKMPSRRPFTNRGKELGRLKVLVTGGKKLGKTSLIKSIVQVCEDIVHVDPIQNSKPSLSQPSNNVKSQTRSLISEVFASTKPYPSWWSDHEIHGSRRKSMGDSVLERNICFVEANSEVETLLTYIKQQLQSSLPGQAARNDLVGLLSGRGGSQVDLVLYLLSEDTLQAGLQNIKQLSEVCNVIPIISQADLRSTEQSSSIKNEVLSQLTSKSIPSPTLPNSLVDEIPYAVSTTNSPDNETMDASLLMSSEYVQPLLPSELSLLVERIFDKENAAYLRHTSAKLLLAWKVHYSTTSPSSPSSPQPSLPTSSASFGDYPSLDPSNSHSLARLADHTQHEEKLAHIRLTNWASELQRSLQRERERYESLARGERAVWLVDRMGEELQHGSLIPVQRAAPSIKHQRHTFIHSGTTHDPLGLLHWSDTLQTSGWLALQIVGSLGVVGGLTLWLARNNRYGPFVEMTGCTL
ncbi:MAG: hypothetical protein Q9160_001803 [Pyrenula sp. 1 TL-2023]